MLHDVEEETRIKQILEVLDKALRLATKIDEVVGRLSEKRVTLEEKMIRSYFHKVAANLHGASSLLHRALAVATTPAADTSGGSGGTDEAGESKQKKTYRPETATEANISRPAKIAGAEHIKAACAPFDQFLDRLEINIDQLLKALRYDMNYVEQYFEFNYYNKLTNEDRYLQDSDDVLKQLSDLL